MWIEGCRGTGVDRSFCGKCLGSARFTFSEVTGPPKPGWVEDVSAFTVVL